MFKTQQEVLESIQLQLSELLSYFKPKETDSKEDLLLRKLDDLSIQISNNQIANSSPKLVFDDTKIEDTDEDFDKLSDNDFIKRRNWFAIALAVITAILSWVAYLNWLGLFPMIFGYFVVAGGLNFALVFDYYMLPGNTIKRISKNAIASAIIILSFIILYIGGVTIGNSLITNRERGEEYSAPTPTKTEPAVPRAEPERQLDTVATDKEN